MLAEEIDADSLVLDPKVLIFRVVWVWVFAPLGSAGGGGFGVRSSGLGSLDVFSDVVVLVL